MNIVTQEMLVDNLYHHVLKVVYDHYQNDPHKEGYEGIDEWLYEKRAILGEIVYCDIGDTYGSVEDALKELGID